MTDEEPNRIEERYREFFRAADVNGTNAIEYNELEALLKPAGYTKNTIAKYFRAADLDGDKVVSMEEFLTALGVETSIDYREAGLRRAFNEFDRNGNGIIEKEELRKVFEEYGKNFTQDELKRMIRMSDSDGDGKFEYEEFIAMFFGKKKK